AEPVRRIDREFTLLAIRDLAEDQDRATNLSAGSVDRPRSAFHPKGGPVALGPHGIFHSIESFAAKRSRQRQTLWRQRILRRRIEDVDGPAKAPWSIVQGDIMRREEKLCGVVCENQAPFAVKRDHRVRK